MVRIQNPAGLRRCNSLPHPSSLPPPLWMLWEANERGGGSSAFYIGGSLLPPAGRLPGLPPRHRAAGTYRPAAGRQPPLGAKMRLKINFIYIKVSAGGRQGAIGV